MKPRALMISTEFPPGPGGIGSHALSVTRELVRRGWNVTVASPQDYASDDEIREFRRVVEADGFDLVRLRHWPGAPVQGSVWALRLADRLLRRRPHLVIATGQRAVWLAAPLARIFLLPWAAVVHGTEVAGKSGFELRLNRATFSSADAVVWVSRFTRGVGTAAGIRPRRSTVIPNGADGERFRPLDPAEVQAFRRRHDEASPGRLLLLTVGHVDRRKGQDVVVRALPKILAEVPEVHYLVLGLATRGDELAALAEELGVADRVHLLGRRPADELLGFLNACDVFVMASRHTESGDFEGFGIAVVEAALCGKPAVVSEESGLVEAVEVGVTGLSAPPEDADALAERLLELLTDPDRLRSMGEVARRRARDEQVWARRGEQYHRLFRDLIGRPSPEAP